VTRRARDTLAQRLDDWLFLEAPPERLAVLRVLVGGFAVIYLGVRFPVFVSLADRRGRVEGVGLLWWLTEPLPEPVVLAWLVATLVAGLLFTVGLTTRVAGPCFAVGVLLATTYRSSWGQVLWIENLMVLQLLVVGFSRSGDAWTIRSRSGPPSAPSARYGWPLRLAALVTVMTYVLSGVAKLRIGGLGWMWGDTLRHHIAFSAARLELFGEASSPLGRAVVSHGWPLRPGAVVAVALELAAPVALLGGRLRTVWVVSTWTMHLAIAALMFVVFPFPLSGVAFACFYRLEKAPSVVARLVRWSSSPSTP